MYVIYQSYWSGNKKIPRGLQMITDQSLSHTIYNIRTSFEGTIKKGVEASHITLLSCIQCMQM